MNSDRVLTQHEAPVDAQITVELTDKSMSARLKIARPKNGGKAVTRAMIDEALAEAGVIAGIDENKLEALAANPIYNLPIPVAAGQEPVQGDNASLRFLIERELSLRPKEREDGTVDYHELGLIQQVEENQPLVERTPPTEGVDGYNVLGYVIPARKGRDVALPHGKNTYVSEDGLQLLADKTGHVEFVGGKVMVHDIYIVRGDLSTGTGNINFNGAVNVLGNVPAGFVIEATGNVTVQGACEAATIIAGGNVVIGDGMNGGRLSVEGDLKSKYLQNCHVKVTGNIYADSIVNCDVYCGDSVILSRVRGTLMGGSCAATNLIEATMVGSNNTHVPTRVEVGFSNDLREKMQKTLNDYEQSANFIASIDNVIHMLSQLEVAGKLSEQQIEDLYNARYTREIEYNKYVTLKQDLEAISAKIKRLGFGSIIARSGIAPGVRIVIGPHQTSLTDPKGATQVMRGDDGIVFYSSRS